MLDSATLRRRHLTLQKSRRYLRNLAWKAAHPRGRTVLYGPAVFQNPYQALLYSAFRHRVASVGLAGLKLHQASGLADAYHVHWDEFLLRDARPADAQYWERLEAYRARGGKLIWTVHNAAPHAGTTDAERSAFHVGRTYLARNADLIHVHGEAAGEFVRMQYGAEASRIRVVPHPSYLGWYARVPAAPSEPGKRRFLAFGTFRDNKGLPLILEGFGLAAQGVPMGGLHVAGRGALRAREAPPASLALRITDGLIADDEVERFFSEADFCVFGFSSVLTSGSLMLALTFGTVPIAPDFAPLREVLPTEFAPFLYTPKDPESLARAIAAAASLDDAALARLRDAALMVAQDRAPEAMSSRLEAAVDALFD